MLNKHLHGKKILAVMGMMADKDVESSLANLRGCFSEVIAVKPSNPRSMSAEELSDVFRRLGVNASAAASPAEGVKEALAKASSFDATVVCGSLYLAGDVRNLLIELLSGKDTALN